MAAAIATLLFTAPNSRAVVGQALQVQGTNLVLSWPSQSPYQQYMIEYRQTLDQSTPWNQIANAYPASGTNTTTYTIYGAIPAPQTGNGGEGRTDTNPPPSPLLANSSFAPSEPLATPTNGTGSVVPLALYPLGYDISRLSIYDPATQQWLSGADYVQPQISSELGSQSMDDPQPQDGGGDSPPSSGFYRVWHIPTWSFNITNYIYDGPTFFPVDFADYMDYIIDFQVLLDGQQTHDAEFTSYVFSNGQTNWGMGIYLDRIASGNHTIQLVCTLQQNEAVGDDALYLVLSNQATTITVNNQITFTNWNDAIQADTYAFDVNIANPNSDWWIDIYDANGDYVNTGSGHTSDGHIYWTWNLTDALGVSRSGFDSDPFFYSETTFSTAGSASATTRNNPVTGGGYPNVGQWVTSFMDRWFSDAPGYPYDCQQTYETAMNYVQGGPILKGDPAWQAPIKFGTNVYSQADRELSWYNLRTWLQSPWVRNWYYFGHGGGNTIGADRHTLDTNGLVTGSAWARKGSLSCLHSWQMATATRAFRYRFVFLDGCSTATGDWPNAFNISQTNHDLSFYQNDPKHRRPSAFVGWNKDIGGKGWGTVQTFFDFRSDWMGWWANGGQYYTGLQAALQQANVDSRWIDAGTLNSSMCVYGYTVMQIEDYNHKGDWQYP
jgi:hypothetical protein